jgi:SnoaL-like domain
MSDVLSAVERMEIERACERLTFAYVRALDLGDMNAAADCFAENGSFAALLTRPKSLLTKHLTTSVMIDVEGRDAASGLSYLTMVSTTPPEGAAPPFISNGPVYFGEMRDRFVRENGVWKFLARRGSIQMKFSGAATPS